MKSTLLKFTYSEKATKFCEIFTLLLTVCTVVKSKVKISQNFLAFSEYMNFNSVDFTKYFLSFYSFIDIRRKVFEILLRLHKARLQCTFLNSLRSLFVEKKIARENLGQMVQIVWKGSTTGLAVLVRQSYRHSINPTIYLVL